MWVFIPDADKYIPHIGIMQVLFLKISHVTNQMAFKVEMLRTINALLMMKEMINMTC